MSVIYLRKKNDPYVLIANEALLERNDLFVCDKEGNFLKNKSESMEAFDAEFQKAKDALFAEAKKYGIKNYKNLKITTLMKKVNQKIKEEIVLEIDNG
jgi:hypothetical protein